MKTSKKGGKAVYTGTFRCQTCKDTGAFIWGTWERKKKKKRK